MTAKILQFDRNQKAEEGPTMVSTFTHPQLSQQGERARKGIVDVINRILADELLAHRIEIEDVAALSLIFLGEPKCAG